MNAERNIQCRENQDSCWICKCGKHHNCKDGAEKCCTKDKSELCDCRWCKNLI